MSKQLKLISLNGVCAKSTLSRTAINNHRAAGNFPEAVKLGEKRIAFVESEIDQWIAERIAARNQRAVPNPASTYNSTDHDLVATELDDPIEWIVENGSNIPTLSK